MMKREAEDPTRNLLVSCRSKEYIPSTPRCTGCAAMGQLGKIVCEGDLVITGQFVILPPDL